MIESTKTAREMFADIRANPRPRFGFGRTCALVHVDLQRAYTEPASFVTAYETDPAQMDHCNALSDECRRLGWPVVWTYVAYHRDGSDCGPWGQRTDTPDSLQNIKEGSVRAELDPRLTVDPRDHVMNKRMASAFHETHLASLLTFHKVDTVIVTGGSTSGCVRATIVDALSHGYRPIVPIECVADRHESPHFANLYDMAAKYADVLPVDEVLAHLRGQERAA